MPGNCDETSSDSTVNSREGHDSAAGVSIIGCQPFGILCRQAANPASTGGVRHTRPATRNSSSSRSGSLNSSNTTDSHHALPVYENVLDRQFEQRGANRAWVSDITYIRTLSGWLYLAVVLDLYSRKIVGWTMAPNMPAELVCTALQIAIAQRRPPPGLIVHSDRGSQYASHEYRELLARHGLQGSMSRKGNCWDNAVIERFFLNLKMERVWRRQYAKRHPAQPHYKFIAARAFKKYTCPFFLNSA